MNALVTGSSDLLSPTPSRILLVDDEACVRRLISTMVTGFGHQVEAVTSADEALEALLADQYHVALIDLSMPGRTGLGLLNELGSRRHSVVPILLTGSDDIAAIVGCMKSGAFDYLAKPCARATLFRAVERAIAFATSRHRERELELVASTWAATFDACPDALLILDSDCRVQLVNAATGRLRKSVRGAAQDRSVEELLGTELGTVIRARLRIGDDVAVSDEPVTQVYDAALDRHFHLSVTPVRTSATRWVIVASDVTGLVRGEAERRHLLRRILTTQEDERGRLARELHDGIGQSLVSLAVGLANAEPLLPPDEVPAREALSRLRQAATENLGEIRRLAQGLRPAVLDDLGLAVALRRMVDTFSALHRIRADLVAPDEPIGRLSREVESAVYRIVQEALANVAKHARAETVDVVLEVDDGIRVMVTDDGRGFQPAYPSPGGSLGLTGMRERAKLLGGRVRVESTPGRGTTIDARIPIQGG